MSHTPEELLIVTLADMLRGDRHVAVGAASPIPGAAALLAKSESPQRMHVAILHSLSHNPFAEGARELFDAAAQGRIDTFFLGGVQIDGSANINLVGLGDYPNLRKRFPGSFGSALMYFAVPRVILFREEHSRRVLVPQVDFISAPGPAAEDSRRGGGPHALLTDLALFTFDRERRRFCLESVHPGHGLDEVIASTGFDFDRLETVPETPTPDAETLALIRGPVAREIARTYPRFAAKLFPDAVAAS